MINKDNLEKILHAHFKIEHLTIADTTIKHARHPEAMLGGGGHFQVLIVSDDFKDKPQIQRHRLIYNVLEENMDKDIHALALKCYTTEEYESKR